MAPCGRMVNGCCLMMTGPAEEVATCCCELTGTPFGPPPPRRTDPEPGWLIGTANWMPEPSIVCSPFRPPGRT